jgi:hypothetical protein
MSGDPVWLGDLGHAGRDQDQAWRTQNAEQATGKTSLDRCLPNCYDWDEVVDIALRLLLWCRAFGLNSLWEPTSERGITGVL